MKKYIPYLIAFFLWLILSLTGNVYKRFDNNLELNVGRINECFKENEIYLYINNTEKENVDINYSLTITTTNDSYNYDLNFSGNKKRISNTIRYSGKIKEIKVNDNLIDYNDTVVYKSKFFTFILRYSLISLIICFSIIYLFIEFKNKLRKKYDNLKAIKENIKIANQ